MCMSVSVSHVCGGDWKPEKGLASSGAGVTEMLGIGVGNLLGPQEE